MGAINEVLRTTVPPEAFRVSTGDEEEAIINDRTLEYFAEIRGRLGMQAQKWHAFLEMRYLGLTTRFGGESDDMLIALVFADEVLAGCLDTRTSSNVHTVSFFVGKVTELAETTYKNLSTSERKD